MFSFLERTNLVNITGFQRMNRISFLISLWWRRYGERRGEWIWSAKTASVETHCSPPDLASQPLNFSHQSLAVVIHHSPSFIDFCSPLLANNSSLTINCSQWRAMLRTKREVDGLRVSRWTAFRYGRRCRVRVKVRVNDEKRTNEGGWREEWGWRVKDEGSKVGERSEGEGWEEW